MFTEKPWERPFHDLLNKMSERWPNGTIATGKNPDQAAVSSSIWQYPRFIVDIEGVRFVISVGEFPIGSADILDSADNVEYLRIEATTSFDLSLTLRHEGFYDRVRKRFLFAYEFQTGVADFDRDYLIDAQTDIDRRLVANGEFQRCVRELEPLSNLAFLKHSAGWSQELREESQLTLEAVAGRVAQFRECVELALKSR